MIVVTKSSIEPTTVITVADAAAWSNNIAKSEDARLLYMIGAAVEHAESSLNRAIFSQTRRTVTDRLPPSRLQLEPFRYLSVTRVADDGTEAVVTGDFIQEAEAGFVLTRGESIERFDSGWDSYRYRFDYDCGWDADDLPDSIRVMILGYVSHIARYHGQVANNDQFLKQVPQLCRPYAIPIVQRPRWIIV